MPDISFKTLIPPSAPPSPPLPSDFASGTSNPDSNGVFTVETALNQVSNDYGTESLWILDKTASGKTRWAPGAYEATYVLQSPPRAQTGQARLMSSSAVGVCWMRGTTFRKAQAEGASHQGIRHVLNSEGAGHCAPKPLH